MKRTEQLSRWLSASLLFAASSVAIAGVKLPAVIGDNMVLQRDAKVPIWGTAEPNEGVTVALGEQRISAKTDANGRWMVKLATLKVGGPFEMTIAGTNKITLKNILLGDVWVCSGQSNMDMPVRAAANAEQEIADANYPKIRLFYLKKESTEEPRLNAKGEWAACGPDTVAGFSAVGYYFGREIHKKLGVPIGLIHNAWGGTPAEAWTKRSTLESDAEFKPIMDRYAEALVVYPEKKKEFGEAWVKWNKYQQAADKAKAEGRPPATLPEGESPPKFPPFPLGPGHAHSPGGLYNGMVLPLVPYAIQGVIWYQGESNANRAYQYRRLFPALIRDWRSAWGQGDFPFLFVQLPNFQGWLTESNHVVWAELREAQLMTLSLPNTGMAVTVDIGDADEIHPKNKQDVGRRLALAAEAIVYHCDVVYSGPIYDAMTIDGDKVRLRFKHVGGGLIAKDGDTLTRDTLTGFAIAGEDRKFVQAKAEIEGDTVVVTSNKIPRPVAVRYDWASNPTCNLYNKAGLPASPFRTDAWPGITTGKR